MMVVAMIDVGDGDEDRVSESRLASCMLWWMMVVAMIDCSTWPRRDLALAGDS